MQNLFHDGGFSLTGVSEAIVKTMTAAAGVEDTTF
jgi:hypothetical protein